MTQPVDIVKESITRSLFHGHKTVGTTAVRLISTELATAPKKGVLVRCPGADDSSPNTAEVWIGNTYVTADEVEATGGLPILPGASLFIPIDDPRRLFCISTSLNQDIAWLAV